MGHTLMLEERGVTNSCREYTHPRDEIQIRSETCDWRQLRLGPVLEVLVTTQFGRYGKEVRMDSLAWNDV